MSPSAAVVPAPHDARGRRRILEAQRAERLQGAGIVVGAGEDEIATGSREAWRFLEQAGVVTLDAAQALQQVPFERAEVGIAQEDGQCAGIGFAFRHAVRLLVVDHLQAMFDPAQEAIGLDQLLGRPVGDVARDGKRAQGLDSPAQSQRHVAAAEDQLLGLGEELDLADAAATELNIVAEHLDRSATSMGIDLPLDRMNVVDRREVEMLAPDIGAEFGQERFADGAIAGDGMRLDHRGTFPVLADALVIELGGLHRHGKRRRPRIGPQPQIGPEDVAVDRALRHQLHQEARDADKMARRLLVVAQGGGVAVVEQDQVDVARIVEFLRAELAHAEHGEGRRIGIRADGELSVAGEPQEHGVEHGLQAAARDMAEGAGDLGERPDARDIRHGDDECRPALEATERRGYRLRRTAAARLRLYGR